MKFKTVIFLTLLAVAPLSSLDRQTPDQFYYESLPLPMAASICVSLLFLIILV